jgi:hypothetical protein
LRHGWYGVADSERVRVNKYSPCFPGAALADGEGDVFAANVTNYDIQFVVQEA